MSRPSIAEIKRTVADVFGVPISEISSKRRARKLCRPRFAVCLIARDAGYSGPQIGRALGGRDHTTIISAIRRAEYWREQDLKYRFYIENAQSAIKCQALAFVRHDPQLKPVFRSVRGESAQ